MTLDAQHQPRDINDHLLPDDVVGKQFTTVRWRTGYDEAEVDDFLDDVEATYARLMRENDELRGRAEKSEAEVQQYQPQIDEIVASVEVLARRNRSLRNRLFDVALRANNSLVNVGRKNRKPTLGESTLALDILDLIGDINDSRTQEGVREEGSNQEGSKEEGAPHSS